MPAAEQRYNDKYLLPQDTVAQSDSTSMAEGSAKIMTHVRSDYLLLLTQYLCPVIEVKTSVA